MMWRNVMKKEIWYLKFLLVFVAVMLAVMPAMAETSGLADQKSVELTVYNSNLGLVKDRRTILLGLGERELRFMGVASAIIPQSVHIKSLNASKKLKVLEQNYEFDLLSPQKLLEKYVGKEIKIVRYNEYKDREKLVTAKVLSTNNGTVLQVGDEITFGYDGRMVFPDVPENLISKPTLVWLLENSLSNWPHEVEATYLTTGISWQADYVLTLDADDKKGDITGWVTVTNQSGTQYRNAKLKLVAGDVSRVMPEPGLVMKRMNYEMAAEPEFEEKAFFEYHIYTLERPTTVKENQTKQIRLLSANGINIKKEYVYHGAEYYYRSRYGQVSQNEKVGVFIEFENEKDNNLGMPLPKGVIRLYKRDHEDSLQFIGEDSIDHTPKDETVRLRVGEAFDIVGERVQTGWKKLRKNLYEAEYEITIRNHKEEDIEVRVIEPIPGDWTMVKSSHEHKKTEAFTAEFRLNVSKDGETKLKYRVRMDF
jgi:hypothetical protein